MPVLKNSVNKDKNVRICTPSGSTYPETISQTHTCLTKILNYLVKKYETEHGKIKDLTTKYRLVKVKDLQNCQFEDIKYRRQINNDDLLLLLKKSEAEQQEVQEVKDSKTFQKMIEFIKQNAESLSNFETTNDLSENLIGYDKEVSDESEGSGEHESDSFGTNHDNYLDLNRTCDNAINGESLNQGLSKNEEFHLTDTDVEIHLDQPENDAFEFLINDPITKVVNLPPDSQKSIKPTFADRVKMYGKEKDPLSVSNQIELSKTEPPTSDSIKQIKILCPSLPQDTKSYEIFIQKSRLIPDTPKQYSEDIIIEISKDIDLGDVNLKFIESESEKSEFVKLQTEIQISQIVASQEHIKHEDTKVKIGLIKEEIIDDNRKKLDSEIIARAEREQDAMMNTNYSVVQSGELQIPKPKHLSYKNYIIEKVIFDDAQRHCKKDSVNITKYLGSDYDNHGVVLTPDFEDYISGILYVKDRFSLENYIQKLSVNKGFKILPVTEKGVTRRDYKGYRAKGFYGGTNGPFELNYRKLAIEGHESDSRFYLAYYRSIHNHALEANMQDEQINNDKENDMHWVQENMDWMSIEDQKKYYKMLSKIYGKKIGHPPLKLNKRDKKSGFKDNELFENKTDELDRCISDGTKMLSEQYNDDIDNYLEGEYKQSIYVQLLAKSLAPNPYDDFNRYTFDDKFYAIPLPIDDDPPDETEVIHLEDSKDTLSCEITMNKSIEKGSKDKFMSKIDNAFSDDYSFIDID